MAQGVIGTKVKLDGEKEYKDALAALNRSYKTLTDELAYVTERYADNAESAEALQAKGEMLQKQLDKQREKVATLEKALESVNGDYDESSKVVQEWEQKLFRAKTETLKLEKALQQNEQALGKAEGAASDFGKELDAMDEQVKAAADQLEKVNKETVTWGDCLKAVGDKLGFKLPDSVRSSLDKLDKLDKSFLKIAAGAAAAVAAIVKIEKQLISLTTQSAETMEKLSNAASSGGMSIQSAQEWDHVLRSVGSSLESAGGDLAQLQVKITEAAKGTGEAKEIFDKLRISVADSNGALKSTDQLLPELVEKLQRMGDTTERNAVANKLLGGTGTTLIPILNKTGDELQALIEEKKQMGVLSEKEVADLKRTAEAQRKYTEAIEASKDQIAGEYAPAVADLYSASADAITSVSKMLKNSGVLEFGEGVLDFVSSFISNIGEAADKVDEWCDRVRNNAKGLQGPLEVFAALADAFAVIGGILTLDWEKVKTHLGWGNEQSYLQKWWNPNATNVSTWDESRGTWIGNSANEWHGDTMTYVPNTSENKTSYVDPEVLYEYDPKTKLIWNRYPANAAGIDHWPGGMTWVGENGPERVWLPEGTRIQTAQESRGGGDTFHITIPARDIKEFNDIVRIAKNARRAERMGTT